MAWSDEAEEQKKREEEEAAEKKKPTGGRKYSWEQLLCKQAPFTSVRTFYLECRTSIMFDVALDLQIRNILSSPCRASSEQRTGGGTEQRFCHQGRQLDRMLGLLHQICVQ